MSPGVLAVTRSLGDSSMKEFVVGSPYTTETVLDDADEFLIVACDGVSLWLACQRRADTAALGCGRRSRCCQPDSRCGRPTGSQQTAAGPRDDKLLDGQPQCDGHQVLPLGTADVYAAPRLRDTVRRWTGREKKKTCIPQQRDNEIWAYGSNTLYRASMNVRQYAS